MDNKLIDSIQERLYTLEDKHYRLKDKLLTLQTDISNLKSAIADIYDKVNRNTSIVDTLNSAYDTLQYNVRNYFDIVNNLDLNHIQLDKNTTSMFHSLTQRHQHDIDIIKEQLLSLATTFQEISDRCDRVLKVEDNVQQTIPISSTNDT